jgi:lincosamide and streptogramin A transport system ATP-binding/permease protein
MSTIIIKDLTFAYPGGDNLFTNLSLNINTNWKLGLVGRNGRGKTTFLKLLEGTLEHKGAISIPFPLSYFPMTVLDDSLSAFEILSHISPDIESLDWRLKREAEYLKLSELALKSPLSSLSGGEVTKVLLSFLFIGDEYFPLIDEPTRNLDRDARKVVRDYLSSKKGFILVSHDRNLLDVSVDHILALNLNGVDLERGNFSSWWANKEQKDKNEELTRSKLKKEIVRLEKAGRRNTNWANQREKDKYGENHGDRGFIGHKAAKMNKRAKSIQFRIEKAVEDKSSLIQNTEAQVTLSLNPLPWKGDLLAWGKDIKAGYTEKAVLKNLSFSITPGERLAVVGPNGSGKSLFLKLLLGESKILNGEFNISKRAVISYIPQVPNGIQGALRDFSKENGLDEGHFKSILRLLGFSRRQLDCNFSELSLGQKKKTYLARSILTKAHLYIWDEPLSHVDVITKMEIENLLIASKPTLIICEHDMSFLEKVATSFLEIKMSKN